MDEFPAFVCYALFVAVLIVITTYFTVKAARLGYIRAAKQTKENQNGSQGTGTPETPKG